MKKLFFGLIILAVMSPGALFANTCPAMTLSTHCNTAQGCVNGPTQVIATGYDWQGIGCVYLSELFTVTVYNPEDRDDICQIRGLFQMFSQNVVLWSSSTEVFPRFRYHFPTNWPNHDACVFDVLTSSPYQ